MTHFVPASKLYHVESGTPIAHPAHQATDADVRRALEDDREVCTDGGQPTEGSNRPGGAGECPQGCVHPVAGSRTLETREEREPIEPPSVFEVYGETVVKTERVRRYSTCIVCGWVIDR